MHKKNIFIFLTIFLIIFLEKKVFSNTSLYIGSIKNYDLSKSNEKIQFEDSKKNFVRTYEDKIANNIDYTNIENTILNLDKIDNFKINGKLPFFYNFFNKTFENYLNNKILELFRKNYKSEEEKNNIYADYDIYEYDNIVSVVVKFYKKDEDNKDYEIIETLNYNKNSLNILTLEDILGKDYKEYILQELDFKLEESNYNLLLKEVLKRKILNEYIKFYIENKDIILIFDNFDKYIKDISLVDILKFKVSYKNNKTVTLDKNKYYKVNNIDLIPMSVLVKDFGMNIKINKGNFDFYKNENFIVRIYLNENKYEMKDKIVTISTAPILVNGIDLALPFDFFENILNVSVIKNSNKDIIMKEINKNNEIKI